MSLARFIKPAGKLARIIFVAGIASVSGAAAAFGAWPERPVRVVTLAGAGGGSDAVARVIAERLANRWNQPVVVENRPGADGMVAVEAFLAARDGHTLLFANMGTYSVNPLLHEKLSYEPKRDLIPISFVVEDFMAVVARPSFAGGSLGDLVAAAKAKPEQLNYTAVPGLPYLAFFALQKTADAPLTFVAYRNPIGAVPDLIEGRIDAAVLPLATVLGQIHAGKVKALAVMNPVRAPAAPDVPSAPEAGYGDFAFASGLGLFAPKEMPPETRSFLAAASRAVLGQADVREKLLSFGYLPRGSTQAEFAGLLENQALHAASIARAYGAKPEAAR
jgi:tripartite-type tricarboxylate transporter receptor subunit TctC